jgi:hypothetical protein
MSHFQPAVTYMVRSVQSISGFNGFLTLCVPVFILTVIETLALKILHRLFSEEQIDRVIMEISFFFLYFLWSFNGFASIVLLLLFPFSAHGTGRELAVVLLVGVNALTLAYILWHFAGFHLDIDYLRVTEREKSRAFQSYNTVHD